MAEKLRRAVEELPPLRGGMTDAPTQITLSVGGASLAADEVDAELLVSRADQALYQAKGNGRQPGAAVDGRRCRRPSRRAPPRSPRPNGGAPERAADAKRRVCSWPTTIPACIG